MRWCRGHGGGELSGNGSCAGCAGACGIREMYGGGSCGSSAGSPWNIGFFPFCFFFLSGWTTNTLLCPCLFVQSLAHGGRVCAIRSQESMYGK